VQKARAEPGRIDIGTAAWAAACTWCRSYSRRASASS
jgi:hypothetical protein